MSLTEIHEYESEPLPGLPDRLPEGEELLWQGAPERASVLRHVVHLRKLALYFLLLLGLGFLGNLAAEQPPAQALINALSLAPLALVPLAIAWLWGRAIARSTVYTLTSRRLMLRFGVALPVILNIPLKQVNAAGLKLYADGTGDIPLDVRVERRMSYLVLWPHAKPWQFWPVMPMLRSVPDAATVAEKIAGAWRDEAGASALQTPPPSERRSTTRSLATAP